MSKQTKVSLPFTGLCAAIAALLCLGLTSCAGRRAEPPGALSPSSRVEGTRSGKEKEAPVPPSLSEGPLELSIAGAVLMALENNRELRVERTNPDIRRTFEEEERAAFDPVLSAQVSASRDKDEDRAGGTRRDTAAGAGAGFSRFSPTGTTVGVEASTDRDWSTGQAQQHTSRFGVTVTRALRRGKGLDTNLADWRQARIDTDLSAYELRGLAEALVARVETVYWDYVLALRQVEIFEASFALAQKQEEEARHRIRVGGLAETEIAAAQAEVALRREALINTRSRVDALRVRMLRLVLPMALAAGKLAVVPTSKPTIPSSALAPLGAHQEVALRCRPDLNQARLQVGRQDLELTKTRNGLLPRMDLFVRLGRTGYADSFGRSVGDLGGDGYDAAAGLTFELPRRNREARARHRRALLVRTQVEESLRNVEDLVREDVALARIEVQRTRQQVDATAATRRFQEEKHRAETAKFRVGKTTALLVAQAQRDLVASQVAEVEALANYLKARTDLFRLDGSLLERRGIAAPGAEPAEGGPGASSG